jgi:hypothetical protein
MGKGRVCWHSWFSEGGEEIAGEAWVTKLKQKEFTKVVENAKLWGLGAQAK